MNLANLVDKFLSILFFDFDWIIAIIFIIFLCIFYFVKKRADTSFGDKKIKEIKVEKKIESFFKGILVLIAFIPVLFFGLLGSKIPSFFLESSPGLAGIIPSIIALAFLLPFIFMLTMSIFAIPSQPWVKVLLGILIGIATIFRLEYQHYWPWVILAGLLTSFLLSRLSSWMYKKGYINWKVSGGTRSSGGEKGVQTEDTNNFGGGSSGGGGSSESW